MRDHLNRLTKVVAVALLIDHTLIDTSRGDVVLSRGADIEEALIVTQVQIRFVTILCHIALAMLVRIERARVDVYIRVKLLYRNLVPTSLKQFAKAGGYNTLTKRGDHASCHKDVSCIGHNCAI